MTVEGSGDTAVYTLGPPQGMLVARVPVYGKLRFRDRAGQGAEQGVNVGDEWTYRSFIAGGDAGRRHLDLRGTITRTVSRDASPTAIPLEMTIEVFRTHKGDIEKPILGSLWVRNPQTGRKVEVRNFLAKKFATDVQWIPRTLSAKEAGKAETLDLFRDLVGRRPAGGRACSAWRAGSTSAWPSPTSISAPRDASFAAELRQGLLGIWLQMVLVLALGVMFSTFLSGPVALMATLGHVVAGLFSGFMGELAAGKVIGGGPFESLHPHRHAAEPGRRTGAGPANQRRRRWATACWRGCCGCCRPMLPAFDALRFRRLTWPTASTSAADCCSSGVLRAAAFVLPVAVAGYFFLKLREVAK